MAVMFPLAYLPLNLPEGTTHGPFSFRGEKVNFRCKNSLEKNNEYILLTNTKLSIISIQNVLIDNESYLMTFGTLHHHGSIIGFRNALMKKNC